MIHFSLSKCWGIYDQLLYLFLDHLFLFPAIWSLFPAVDFNGILTLFIISQICHFCLLWISMRRSKAAVHEDVLNGNYYWASPWIFVWVASGSHWWNGGFLLPCLGRMYDFSPFPSDWLLNPAGFISWNLPSPSDCLTPAGWVHCPPPPI